MKNYRGLTMHQEMVYWNYLPLAEFYHSTCSTPSVFTQKYCGEEYKEGMKHFIAFLFDIGYMMDGDDGFCSLYNVDEVLKIYLANRGV